MRQANPSSSAAWQDGFSGARVLVTGGLGFIGSRLAIRLADYGARVTILDNLAPDTGANRYNAASIEGRASIHIGEIGRAHV
jgi:UDP-glucose 4-epimerase